MTRRRKRKPPAYAIHRRGVVTREVAAQWSSWRYSDEKSLTEIAEREGVAKSTVSRHTRRRPEVQLPRPELPQEDTIFVKPGLYTTDDGRKFVLGGQLGDGLDAATIRERGAALALVITAARGGRVDGEALCQAMLRLLTQ